MREFKAQILVALALAFVGGTGFGAWIGNLRAASPQPARSIDNRMEDWKARYSLTPSQERRIREVLVRYDAQKAKIQSELDSEHWRRIWKLGESCREEIHEILGQSDAASPGKPG